MRISYDETVDAVYITLANSIVERTVEIDPGTLVDVDRAGNLVGIEVIRPARDWPLSKVTEEYRLKEHDLQALEALWPDDNAAAPYPFTRRIELAS